MKSRPQSRRRDRVFVDRGGFGRVTMLEPLGHNLHVVDVRVSCVSCRTAEGGAATGNKAVGNPKELQGLGWGPGKERQGPMGGKLEWKPEW